MTELPYNNAKDIANLKTHDLQRTPLDIHGHRLRTAAMRRLTLHFAFRVSHKEQTVEEMLSELAVMEVESKKLTNGLPKGFQFNKDKIFINRDQLITFILLQVTFRSQLQSYMKVNSQLPRSSTSD